MTNKMFGGSGTPRSRCLILLNSPNLMVKGGIDPYGSWDMATSKTKGRSIKIAAGKSRASYKHVVSTWITLTKRESEKLDEEQLRSFPKLLCRRCQVNSKTGPINPGSQQGSPGQRKSEGGPVQSLQLEDMVPCSLNNHCAVLWQESFFT